MIEIKINDSEVQTALRRLLAKAQDLTPVMQDIGECLLLSTKRRFADGKAPDGTPWAANKQSTILNYLRQKGGDTSRRPGEKSNNPYYGKKDGLLNTRGIALVTAKRPLIGESRRLSTEINYKAGPRRVVLGSSLIQSAVQQFGAKKGAFGSRGGRSIPWGDIPARPFLGLSEQDRVAVIAILTERMRLP